MADDELKQIIALFLEESGEGLEIIEAGLLGLEPGVVDPDRINDIFRAAHSIKGGAATFGFDSVAEFAHRIETILDQMRNGERSVTETGIDLLLRSVDGLASLMHHLGDDSFDTAHIEQLAAEIESFLVSEDTQDVPQEETKKDETADQSERAEVTPIKAAQPSGATESGSIRVSAEKVDSLLNLVGELVITQSILMQQGDGASSAQTDALKTALAQLTRHTRELQDAAMDMRMLPMSVGFSRFPRLIRDLAGQLGKKIQLVTRGDSTEVDKTVIEKVGDPLVHLVRNSIDHGIETVEERLAAGKPETGIIELAAYHESGTVVIEVRDDGAGINTEKVLQKARASGLVDPSEDLSEHRVQNLIFKPGFSTADEISEISGRGVGMDVVRANINDLGGQISVSSEKGKGSCFKIRLPLTLAILDGQLMRIGDEVYVVSLVDIVETVQHTPEHVSTIAGETRLYQVRDEYLPVISLRELFDIPALGASDEDSLLVIVEHSGSRYGILVDDLQRQQQVVIKSLDANFRQIRGLAGATILGNGQVALIIDIPGLVKTFYETRNAETSAMAAGGRNR